MTTELDVHIDSLIKSHLALNRVTDDDAEDPDARDALRLITPDEALAEAVEAMEAKLLTPAQLMALPQPEPIVEGVLYANSFAALFGPPGSYKSFHARDLAAAIATGRAWHGKRVKRGRVLYVVAEAPEGFGKRMNTWCAYEGVAPADLEGWLTFYPHAVNLFHREEAPVVARVAERLDAELVVFDTLSQCASGADENAAKDVAVIIDAARQVREATRGCVLFVHHTPKNGPPSLRGHSSLHGALDTMIRAAAGEGGATLTCEKQKDEAKFKELAFREQAILGSLMLVQHDVWTRPETSPHLLAIVQLVSNADLGPGLSASWIQQAMPDVGRSTVFSALKKALTGGYLVNKSATKVAKYGVGPAGEALIESMQSNESNGVQPVSPDVRPVQSNTTHPRGVGVGRDAGQDTDHDDFLDR